ncbi:hypothetical protein [Candidatus Palauibacter soopunensis]|uniref:hypothetical protein n=1 Tax=Candidatus Palauibacter soopunensis TaxID=3056739 RepID=UPI00238BA60A|nr:hypothetical protein [Candidatus Palauibacter soopunensis]MDE2879899.1 hypothetical protein [Candidatus Palauibacter soopunensis]
MIPQRPLGFGEILDGAIQFYRRDFGLYFLIALVGSLPGYAMGLAVGVPSTGVDSSGNPAFGDLGLEFAILLPAAAISWIATLAVAVAICARLEGRSASLENAYRGVLRPFPSAAGGHLLALLIVFLGSALAMIPVIVLGGIGIAASGNAVVAAVFFGIVGLSAALAVLGLWFWTSFAIFPAVLMEGRTAAEAVRRSLKLSKGARLRILGIMLVVLIIRDGPSFGIFALFGGLEMFTSPATAGTVSAGVMALQNTLDLLFGSLITPFAVATLFLLYHDRRVRLEAADLETAAATMATDGP